MDIHEAFNLLLREQRRTNELLEALLQAIEGEELEEAIEQYTLDGHPFFGERDQTEAL